jgi:hypothetical protein
MKFSEAIVEGLKDIKFTNRTWLEQTAFTSEKSCTGCLVGAALYSMGEIHHTENILEQLENHWPWLDRMQHSEEILSCPICNYIEPEWAFSENKLNPGRIGFLLTHLAQHYQSHVWYLDRIVKYVQTLEEKYDVVEVKEEEPCEELISK